MEDKALAPSSRPVRLSREQSRAATRERLLDAARRAFARAGYAGASVDVIAAEAGFSKGAFYSNFDTKEAIFLELLARHMASEAEELDRLVGALASLESVMERLDTWFSTPRTDIDWALLATELQLHARRQPSFAQQYDALQAAHCERLGALLQRVFKLSGKRMPAPASELAAALIVLAHGLVLQRPANAAGSGRMLRLVLRSLLDAAPAAAAGRRRSA